MKNENFEKLNHHERMKFICELLQRAKKEQLIKQNNFYEV